MSKTVFNLPLSQINTRFLSVSALILSTLLPGSLLSAPANAGELPNGQTAFDNAPRLIEASTSSNSRDNPFATYYFTLEVPEDAGEPLGAIRLEQRGNYSDTIEFEASESRAFTGERFARGSALSLAPIGGPPEPGEVTIVFDQPVLPGDRVTIALKPESNPFRPGIYLFGVTAFPEGENSRGVYLG